MIQRAALLLLATAFIMTAYAASPASAPPLPVLRYHYGDNAGWAIRNFDDSAWPQARNGTLPAPSYQSDGFFWVRAQVAVPAGAAGPLAIESHTLDALPHVQELWVNGRLVGHYGEFPPRAKPLVHPRMLVFDVPAGVVQPGSVAFVALRIWNAPSDQTLSLVLRQPDPVNVKLSIGHAPLLHALADHAQDRAWLRLWPQFLLAFVFIMSGLAVLALGIWARDRTLLLCALWLAFS